MRRHVVYRVGEAGKPHPAPFSDRTEAVRYATRLLREAREREEVIEVRITMTAYATGDHDA